MKTYTSELNGVVCRIRKHGGAFWVEHKPLLKDGKPDKSAEWGVTGLNSFSVFKHEAIADFFLWLELNAKFEDCAFNFELLDTLGKLDAAATRYEVV